MKTTAAVLRQVNEALRIEELQIPELRPGQVLVDVAYSGLCHSQLNEIKGLKGQDRFLPHTLGHEGAGIVAAIGPGVGKVKAGDRVVLTWIKGSGADAAAALYKSHDGTIVNSGAISTFLTKAVISENRLVKIPDEMPLREAALLGCAIPTGAGIVKNIAAVTPANSIAIFGLGGIGLSVLLAAKLSSASKIIAIDVEEEKLEFSRKIGATHSINARQKNVLSVLSEITAKRGVDYAVECAGKKESMEAAFEAVRDNGGLCVIAGNLAFGEKISIDPFGLIKGKRIVGTWGGQTDPDSDILEYAKLYLSGALRLGELITRTFALTQINSAFELLEGGKMGRIIVEL